MNILSDSDSSDSDTGRRYKTESTRAREKFSNEKRREEISEKISYTYDGGSKYKRKSVDRKSLFNLKKYEKRESVEALRIHQKGKRHTSKRQEQYEDHSRDSSKEKDKNKDGNRTSQKSNTMKNVVQRIKKSHSKNTDERGDHKYQSADSEIGRRKHKKNKVKRKESLPNDNQLQMCGPSLPPHMLKIEQEYDLSDNTPMASVKKMYGPSLPSTSNHVTNVDNEFSPKEDNYAEPKDLTSNETSESENEALIGPVPNNVPYKSDAHLKLEQRALELKLAKLNEGRKKDPDNFREEWMTELPELRRVPSLGLTARQFRTKEYDNNKDRSLWTEIPSDRQNKVKEKGPTYDDLAKVNRERMEKVQREHRDYEQAAMARKHKKKHKRDESLLDIHQKNIKKKIQKNTEPVERRPFSRDTDLKVNRFDESVKKSIVKKAQLLDTRFSSGQTKYL